MFNLDQIKYFLTFCVIMMTNCPLNIFKISLYFPFASKETANSHHHHSQCCIKNKFII